MVDYLQRKLPEAEGIFWTQSTASGRPQVVTSWNPPPSDRFSQSPGCGQSSKCPDDGFRDEDYEVNWVWNASAGSVRNVLSGNSAQLEKHQDLTLSLVVFPREQIFAFGAAEGGALPGGVAPPPNAPNAPSANAPQQDVAGLQAPSRIRSDFSETWLFVDSQIRYTGL
ncbi:hypothetical protein PoB_003716100 [Plakobranchus ocellatus]|uniref:Uncharacterized protein n=1 Tax=Plakobranchus ocellatus TaxID=259542 RepID=A0AAV4AR66_9GAST|nr:hypothetical protein PoB_003716100 [Plakobranchus ocellatus]